MTQQRDMKTLPEILGSVYSEAYKCGVGAKHPYNYRSVEAVTDEAAESIAKELMGCLPEKWELYGDKKSLSYHEALGRNKCLDEVRARLTAFIGKGE